MNVDYRSEIDKTLSENLKERLVLHKMQFKKMLKARYLEIIPSLIKYQNSQSVSVDFMKVEVALRNNYDVVIGETVTPKGDLNLQVIGFTKSRQTSGNPSDLFSTHTLNHNDITFIIPERLKRKWYKEISYDNECKNGNFIVLRNKVLNFGTDNGILDYYIDLLSEIVLSRFSLAMQVKINTIFMSDPNDETVNQIVSDIYNGLPYVKTSELFDPEEQIYHMQNTGIASIFKELKYEYENIVSEMNTMLGINSLAVDKASGVSDTEANSNRSFTTSNANIYLDARNDSLKKLNIRYKLNIQAMYNDEVISELQEMANKNEEAEAKGGEESGNNQAV